MPNNIRIRTTPGGNERNINVNINQKFDFIEILSLKISQDEAYRRFCSDYGVVVGRVIVNQGVGVPNAKVSIFIPIDEEDKLDPEILGLYPFEVVSDKDSDGIPYSLLPRNNRGKDDCFTPVGTFPSKREVQDNPEVGEIYCKYYKFTTTTNDSGDFMIFGVPVGTHYMHVDADISDMGILSQRPYDIIKEGVDKNKFYSPTKFKGRDKDPKPTQIKTVSPQSVTVVPFWGDTEECEIGITRSDVDLLTTIIPSCIFMGSIFTDGEKNSVNKRCRPQKDLGKMDEVTTGTGRIEMIRKTDGGKGVERFDVEGGELIDEFGNWAFQVPMNLEYMVTSEEGELVPSADPTKGIPTKGKYRFKIGLDVTGGEGRQRTKAKYLVPHNPDNYQDSDYSFDNTTKDKHFKELSWNKIYTVKNYLPRLQPNPNLDNRNFIGIKDVDEGGLHTPFPFNKMDTDLNPLFIILCIIVTIISFIIIIINTVVITILNIVLSILNVILVIICGIVKAFASAICPVLAFLSTKITKCECKESACIGCFSNCNCSCNDPIIPYIPYIVVNCKLPDGTEQKYAPGGFPNFEDMAVGTISSSTPPCYNTCKGSGTKNWPLELAWDAAYNAQVTELAENPDDADKCDVPPDNPPNTANPFHFPCDKHEGHCPLDTIPPADGGWVNCIALSLADALNVFKFDFYNDWVNGSLFSFLLKYKIKKRGKGREKFCEQDCDTPQGVDNDNKGGADNRCKRNFLLDICTEVTGGGDENNLNLCGAGGDGFKPFQTCNKGKRTRELVEGYIKKYQGELYYAAYGRTNGYRLWATDIVSLGSIFDCDWEGEPKIYEILPETTYNKPPLVPLYDENNLIEINGFDKNGPISHGMLIANVTCVGIFTDCNSCHNVKRLCELGMGLDENRLQDDPPGPYVNDRIGNEDVENEFVRGAFAYVNNDTIASNNPNSVPLIFIDSSAYPQCQNGGYDDSNYDTFRGVDKKYIWEYENSFYFYFGIFGGRTALQKMKRKYFTPCERETEIDFYCIATEIIKDDDAEGGTGSIEIKMVGGVPPFTYQWVGPTVFDTSTNTDITYPLTQDPTLEPNKIEDLIGGVYNVRVIDSVGNISSCSFIVPGPSGVICTADYINVTTNGNNDGEITINANSGTPPYTYEIYSLVLTATTVPPTLVTSGGPFNGSTTIQGNSTTPITAGDYKIVVKDAAVLQTQCETFITLTEPTLPSIDQLICNDPLCYNGKTGSVQLVVSGGVPPYEFDWTTSGGGVIPPNLVNSPIFDKLSSINGLPDGTYEVVVSDTAGQELPSVNCTLVNPPQIEVQLQVVKHLGCYCPGIVVNGKVQSPTTLVGDGNDCDGELRFRIRGGTLDSNNKYKRVTLLRGGLPAVTYIDYQGATYPSWTTWQNVDGLIEGWLDSGSPNYRVEVKDTNDCIKLGPERSLKAPNQPEVIGDIEIKDHLRGTFYTTRTANPNTNPQTYSYNCRYNSRTSPRDSLVIRVKNYGGGWMHTWSKYQIGSTTLPATGFGGIGRRLGRAKFYIEYSDNGGSSWTRHSTAYVAPYEALPNINVAEGDNFNITVPKSLTWGYDDDNHNPGIYTYKYGRKFRIVQVIYQTNTSGVAPSNGGECEDVMNGVICLYGSSTSVRSVKAGTVCGTVASYLARVAGTGGYHDSKPYSYEC